jgi:hypothetical protein
MEEEIRRRTLNIVIPRERGTGEEIIRAADGGGVSAGFRPRVNDAWLKAVLTRPRDSHSD